MEIPRGKFCKLRPASTTRPVGDWPDHWYDCICEFDRHGLDAVRDDMDGEKRLRGKLDALCVQHRVDYASDDISGAWLSPGLVRQGRDVEMAFFKGRGV